MKGAIAKGAPKAVVKIVKGGLRFCKHNSNWLLSALAMLGIGGLTWATIKGTIKAVKLCEEKEVHGAKEIIKTTWKLYIPTVGFFILTTICIAGNAHINAKRLATMTGLYAASQSDLKALKKKVGEMIGPKKCKEVEAEANKELIKNVQVPKEEDICKTGHGNELFIDWMTGQFFRASVDYIELVEERMNNTIQGTVDNMLMRRFMHEQFNLRPCGAADMFWDLYDMKEHGNNEIKLDVSYTGWMEVNGKQEMVAVLKCIPEATGF